MQTAETALVAPRFMTANEVCELFSLNIGTLQALVKQQRFPKPLQIGASNRWKTSEIDAWIDAGCPLPEGLKPLRKDGVGRKKKNAS